MLINRCLDMPASISVSIREILNKGHCSVTFLCNKYLFSRFQYLSDKVSLIAMIMNNVKTNMILFITLFFISLYLIQVIFHFKGTKLAVSAKIIFAYLFGRWWFGYGFKYLWFNIKEQCVSVVFFLMKTSSTHYQGAGVLTKWSFVYIFIHKQLA